MKNEEFMKNELARAEKEIKLWKERSKSWNKKIRNVIGDVTLNMYKNINETGEFRFLIKSQLMNLLNELFDVKPLTPLTEDEDEWDDISKNFGTESKFGYKKYQNKRYPELFKNVYSCGKTEYHDNNRVTCYDPIMDTTFNLGLINKIYDENFPIEMPYMPGESNAYFNVFCFQSDQKMRIKAILTQLLLWTWKENARNMMNQLILIVSLESQKKVNLQLMVAGSKSIYLNLKKESRHRL